MLDDEFKKNSFKIHPCKIREFQKISRIGQGTYGYVYLARRKGSDESFALKRIILHHEDAEGFPLTAIREIKLLNRLKHENIVKLIDIAIGERRDAVFLLLEYCENDIATICKQKQHPFQESEIKTLLKQLLSAVEFLHKNWVIHRDIKLSNLLYTRDGNLKLCDFGLARTISSNKTSDLTPLVVTLWYRPPEILLGSSEYAFSIDMWSVGCVFAELLNEGPIFNSSTEIEQLFVIFALLGTPNEVIWPDVTKFPVCVNGSLSLEMERKRFPFNTLADRFPFLHYEGLELLNCFLTYDPAMRITARVAKNSNYFLCSPYPRPLELMPHFPSFQQTNHI